MKYFLLALAVAAIAAVFFGGLGYRWADVAARFRALPALMGDLQNEYGAVTRKADVKDIQTIWSKNVYYQAEKRTFWKRFEGPAGSGMPIIREREFEAGGADTIKTTIYLNLTGAGLTGDTTLLEGNEEKVVQRVVSFSPTRYKHAVRVGDLAELVSATLERGKAEKLLARWLAGKLDDVMFTEFTGGGTATMPTKNKWAAGTATTRATVADTDAGGKLKLDDISRIKAYAQTELKIEPLRIEDGNEFFGFVVHPYAIADLKINDAKWAQAQREAREAGLNNPLFTGSAGMWDGVILFESTRVPRSLNGNTPDIQVADNIFFGAQAMSRGWLRLPSWREQEFSYGEEYGIAVLADVGHRLNVFDLNATETTGDDTDDTAIGSMVVYTAAVAPSQP